MKSILAVVALAAFTLSASAAEGQPTDAQIQAAFKKADPDNSGTVSRAEARKFGITKTAFDKANPDKDGTLDRKEAAKAGVKSKKDFDAANPDNDGTLDLAEYLQALSSKAK